MDDVNKCPDKTGLGGTQALRKAMQRWAATIRVFNSDVIDATAVANTLDAMADPERCLHCGSKGVCGHDPEDR